MSNTTVNTMFGTFTEDDLKSIHEAINEITNEMNQIQNHKDSIKDVLNALYDNYKIPKKVLRRLAKAHYKNSFQEEVSLDNEFEALYTGLKEAK
jgi:hypothetical protein